MIYLEEFEDSRIGVLVVEEARLQAALYDGVHSGALQEGHGAPLQEPNTGKPQSIYADKRNFNLI